VLLEKPNITCKHVEIATVGFVVKAHHFQNCSVDIMFSTLDDWRANRSPGKTLF
jgi:hypothetical protein